MKSSKTALTTIFVSMFLAVILSGCRVNNGDIGPLYGAWVVTEVDVDGMVYDGWKNDDYDNSFFEFQNNICFVKCTNALNDCLTQTCTWEWVKKDTRIALDFSHYDNQFPPGGYMYGPPKWLLLTQPTTYEFDVVWNGNNKMVWTTVNSEGQTLTYHMKKTY